MIFMAGTAGSTWTSTSTQTLWLTYNTKKLLTYNTKNVLLAIIDKCDAICNIMWPQKSFVVPP